MLSLGPQPQHKEGDKSWPSNDAPTLITSPPPPEQTSDTDFPKNLEGTNISHDLVSE